MIFEGRSYRVQPMGTAQVIFEVVTRQHRIDTELDDVQPRVRRELYLPQDLLGVIRMLGKNEDERPALLDGAGDFSRVRPSGQDIARRDPAANPDALERGANRVGYRAVVRGVRNENIVGHCRGSASRFTFLLLERQGAIQLFDSES